MLRDLLGLRNEVLLRGENFLVIAYRTRHNAYRFSSLAELDKFIEKVKRNG